MTIPAPRFIKDAILGAISAAGYSILKNEDLAKREQADAAAYNQDGLRTVHNHDFMTEPRFQEAYVRGRGARPLEREIHWRIHVAIWAASQALRHQGDFVECGVNQGFTSSAIMHYFDWNKTGRLFWLLDTFTGMDFSQVSEDDLQCGAAEKNAHFLASGIYVNSVDDVRANFAEWRDARIIVGSVPGTLSQVTSPSIAYLHLDMNCSPPEVAALRHFWDRIESGGIVLLDDYGFPGFESQKRAMDRCAAELGYSILSLPTGQGLIVKPQN